MFYEESIINGILCYRTHPRGAWRPLDRIQLTIRIMELKARLEDMETSYEYKKPLLRIRGWRLYYKRSAESAVKGE
jgi:hypothetical protein